MRIRALMNTGRSYTTGQRRPQACYKMVISSGTGSVGSGMPWDCRAGLRAGGGASPGDLYELAAWMQLDNASATLETGNNSFSLI
jgi:hypothetical protein